eukprot:19305-Heterococcus_DN1.PRE.2
MQCDTSPYSILAVSAASYLITLAQLGRWPHVCRAGVLTRAACSHALQQQLQHLQRPALALLSARTDASLTGRVLVGGSDAPKDRSRLTTGLLLSPASACRASTFSMIQCDTPVQGRLPKQAS